MDSTNAYDITSGPSVVECAPNPNFQIEEDSAKVQASEVSNTLNNSESSGEKSTKNPTKDGKFSLKRINLTEESKLKRKKTNPLPTSQMVMESIKALKKRNGASVNAILEYMEGQYKVNPKLIKRYVTKYLTAAVEKGIVERLSGAGDVEKFKIKKVEKIEQKLKGNRKMVKGEKVAKVGQKSNDNKKIKAEKVASVEQKPNEKKAKREKLAKVE